MGEPEQGKNKQEFDKLIAPIAAAQHSLITLADIEKCGGNKVRANARVVAGRWERCGVNVWRLTGVPWTFAARVMAAILEAGDGAVASYYCALRLLGLGHPNAKVEISVPRGRFHRPKGIKVHTSTDLDRCQTVLVDGIPVTDVARTLLDMGRYYRKPKSLAKFVHRARRKGLVTWNDLAATLASHARKGRHGVRVMRAVIAIAAGRDEITESDAELIALSLLREHGFPEPTLQHEVRDADGEIVARMDFAYLDQRTNIEIDGPHHLEPEQTEKDEERDYWLGLHGWTVRRIRHLVPVEQPNKFVRIVRSTLRNAGHPDFL